MRFRHHSQPSTHRPVQTFGSMALILALSGVPNFLSGQVAAESHNARDAVSIEGLVANTFAGDSYSTDLLEGKIVLLDFWATWCSPCLESFPSLKRLEDDLGGDQFQVVSVALYSGEGKDLQWVVDKYELTHTLLVGGEKVPLAFDLLGFPTYLLMGKDGKLIRRYVGDFNYPVARIRKDVLALMNGNSLTETSDL